MSYHGIDLGTTYSCIARLDRNGNPEVIHNQQDASDSLASAVFFESEDNVVIGASAKDMIETDGDRVVQFVKREIGKDNGATYDYFGKTYSAIEISALILKRLKQIAEEQGEEVNDVVITCPAYFGLSERNATMKAGELAGLNVLNLINEPTAAAISFCSRQFQEDRNILVFDLGGGTFDVTVVNMSMEPDESGTPRQQIRVLTTGGNDMLGGKDWDDKLYSHILNACCEENGVTPDDIDAETRQTIRSRVEVAKKKLTNVESTKVKIMVNGAMTNITVTRDEFDSMCSDLVSQVMGYVDHILTEIPGVELDTVLMVGGSSHMPMIRNAVEAKFPGKVQLHEPERAVAMGAALFADMAGMYHEGKKQEGEGGGQDYEDNDGSSQEGSSDSGSSKTDVGPIHIEDQTPRSFGPGVLNRSNEYIVDNLIKQGEKMPANAVKVYSTVADNQARILLRIFEDTSLKDNVVPCVNNRGEEQFSDPAEAVKLLGSLELLLPPQTPKDSPIEVTFQVTAAGAYVKAMNMSTGEIVETEIKFQANQNVDPSNITDLSVSGE